MVCTLCFPAVYHHQWRISPLLAATGNTHKRTGRNTFQCRFTVALPGAGVSSSAALEVAAMAAFAAVLRLDVPARRLAILCQMVRCTPYASLPHSVLKFNYSAF